MIETRVKQCKVQIRPLQESVVYFLTPKNADLSQFLDMQDKTLDGYVLTLKKPRNKSLNANSYMWVLCDKLAKAVGTSKEEIYKLTIKDVGVWIDIMVDSKNAEEVMKCWTNNGIGWVAEKITDNTIRCYKGSSAYTQEELSRLIDELVFECKDMGIETIPESDLKHLIDLWGDKNG